MEYWNIGILGKSKDQRAKKSNDSKVVVFGFPIIPLFQYSIVLLFRLAEGEWK